MRRREASVTKWTRGRIETVAIVSIIILAACLRLYRLGDESLWLDEACSFRFVHGLGLPGYPGDDLPAGASLPPFSMAVNKCLLCVMCPTLMTPLYFVAQYSWARLVGDSEYCFRLLSVVAGLATVFMVFLAGRALYDSRTGLLAGLMLALSQLHIYYSQEVRPYSLICLIGTISIYTLHTSLGSKRGRAWFCLHNLVNLSLAWMHWFAVFLIMAEGLFLLLCRRNRPRFISLWILCQLAIAVSLVLWIKTADLTAVGQNMKWVNDGLMLSWLEGPWKWNPAVWAGCCAVAYLGYMTFRRSVGPRPNAGRVPDNHVVPEQSRHSMVLLLLWLVIPPLSLAVLSSISNPCYVPRYVFYKQPALYLLWGAGISALYQKQRAIGLCAFLVIIGGLSFTVATTPRPLRLDWRGLCNVIVREWQPGDKIAFPGGSAGILVEHYSNRQGRDLLCGKDEVYASARAWAEATKGHRVWLILPPKELRALQGTPLGEFLENVPPNSPCETRKYPVSGGGIQLHLVQARTGAAIKKEPDSRAPKKDR